MAQLPQNKRGYLRGIVGAVITGLNQDGTMPVTPTKVGMKTAQEAPYEREVVEGEKGALHGGGKVLAYVADDDVTVGVNLTLKDARFDAHAVKLIEGGTLIEVAEGADTRVVGWEAPTVADQQPRPVFQVEVYQRSHDGRGAGEGYMRYTFYFCRGYLSGFNIADAEWSSAEFKIVAVENPNLTAGVYKKEFVSTLPTELQ